MACLNGMFKAQHTHVKGTNQSPTVRSLHPEGQQMKRTSAERRWNAEPHSGINSIQRAGLKPGVFTLRPRPVSENNANYKMDNEHKYLI